MIKKMKKNFKKKSSGFTLIELLATIVILGVILTIAVPVVIDVVDNAREKSFMISSGFIESTVGLYFMENPNNIPDDGETVEISVTDLEAVGLLDSADIEANDLSGYIVATGNNNGDYSLDPYIYSSPTGVSSLAEDKLMLNYTFDEYAETTAVSSDNEIDPAAGFYICLGAEGAWSIEEIADYTYKITALVDDPAISTWGNIVEFDSEYTAAVGETVTYSGEIVDRSTTYMYLSTGGWDSMEGFDTLGDRVARTITHETMSWPHDIVIRTFNNTAINAGDYITVRNLQIESNDHATPFAIYSEDVDYVLDYSPNGFDAALAYETQPTWNEEGNYYFDGTDDYIALTDSSNIITDPTALTIAATFNPEYISGSQYYSGRILVLRRSATLHSSALSLNVGFNTVNLLYSDSSTNHKIISSPIEINNWYTVIVTFDNGTYTMYLNGNKVAEDNDTFEGVFAGSAQIGAMTNPMHYYKGYIDEVRVYNRALSSEEVDTLYYQIKN